MTSHEIYIDGHFIDLSDDFDVALLFQSWFFQEITSITSNRSYTAKIPPTPRNIRAIGYSSFEDIVSDYPYKRHTVDYYRNGFQIIRNGLAVITSIDSNINFTFTWGSIQNFSKLSDDSLQDLDDGTFYAWNSTSALLTTADNFGLYKIDFGKGFTDPQYINPSVRASYILDRVKAKYGIDFNFVDAGKYIVPLLLNNGGACNETESLTEFYNGESIDGLSHPFMVISGNPNAAYFVINNHVDSTSGYSGVAIVCTGKVTFAPAFCYPGETCRYVS